MELSTYRVDGISDEEIWEIGRERIESIIGFGRIKARCDLPVDQYEKLRLEAEFNDDPPRHVDILGWPSAEEERLSLANKLCIAVRDDGEFIDSP